MRVIISNENPVPLFLLKLIIWFYCIHPTCFTNNRNSSISKCNQLDQTTIKKRFASKTITGKRILCEISFLNKKYLPKPYHDISSQNDETYFHISHSPVPSMTIWTLSWHKSIHDMRNQIKSLLICESRHNTNHINFLSSCSSPNCLCKARYFIF